MNAKTRKTETPGGPSVSDSADSAMSINAMIGWPVETWLRCQAGMLKATEPVANGWIERRREGANAALEAFERLATCNDIQEAASIQRDWFEGSMRRLNEDFRAFAAHAVSVSQETFAAARQSGEAAATTPGFEAPVTSRRQDETIEQAA